ncbi:MAG TPA: transketolase C-terminal domain-containing protein [Solirubrobacterales bacterium]|nr:transketolase C-terminal domain-containing protein [Solirubrobacterales bacterium]
MELGGARIVRPGTDLTIVTAMTGVAVAAADSLAADGVHAEVIDLPVLRPLDLDTPAESLSRTDRLVFLEEGPRTGGPPPPSPSSASTPSITSTTAGGSPPTTSQSPSPPPSRTLASPAPTPSASPFAPAWAPPSPADHPTTLAWRGLRLQLGWCEQERRGVR